MRIQSVRLAASRVKSSIIFSRGDQADRMKIGIGWRFARAVIFYSTPWAVLRFANTTRILKPRYARLAIGWAEYLTRGPNDC